MPTAKRKVRNGAGRHAVLYPAIVEAARRVDASAVGLIDVRCESGLNLAVDRVGITYDNGQTLGHMSSPVQHTASIVGRGCLPETALPTVVARIGMDPQLDVTDPDDARWLFACHPDAEPEVALLTSLSPELLHGNLSDALRRVPTNALPVVTTTWALSQYSRDGRLSFLRCLEDAGRTVAWVSAEGVGVAPSVPTFGDRPASGHSIIGVAIAEHGVVRADAAGRCWSRGHMLSWLI